MTTQIRFAFQLPVSRETAVSMLRRFRDMTSLLRVNCSPLLVCIEKNEESSQVAPFMLHPACPPSPPSVRLSVHCSPKICLLVFRHTNALIVPWRACLWFLLNLGSVPLSDGYLWVFGFLILQTEDIVSLQAHVPRAISMLC